MRALVTNDDGVDAEGLRQLALVAVAAGLDVVVAAPAGDASGTSASLHAVEKDGQLVVVERALEGLDGVPVYAVEAAPGHISWAALRRQTFGPVPQVVLSGFNRGLNTGRAVLHSGTVGAALTASSRGYPALAASVDVAPGVDVDWDTVRQVAGPVVRWLLQSPGPVAINLNIPNLARDEVRGLRYAPLARFGTVQASVMEAGEGEVNVPVTDFDDDVDPDSDAGLLAAGWATVTAISAPCEASGVDLSGLIAGEGRLHPG